jgi:hypothetical protein
MKLAQLSLAAIVAVGAFTFASATPLENAIKGADISGYVRYRWYSEDDGTNSNKTNRNRFTVPIMFKVPVSDKLTAAVGMFSQQNDYATTGRTAAAAGAYKDSSFNLSRMWFNYADAGWNVKLGRQLIKTPVTEGGITGSYGDGLVASYSGVKNMTFAAAAFTKSNQSSDNGLIGAVMDANSNIYAAAAIGKFGPVNAQLWGFRVPATLDSDFFLQLSGSVAGLSLKGQAIISKLAPKAFATAQAAGLVTDDSGAFYGIQAGYKINNFKLGAGYTTTDSSNGIVTLDGDSPLIKAGKQLYYKTENVANEDTYFFTAGASFGAYGVGAGYIGSSNNGTSTAAKRLDSADEYYVQGSYKYNKHFGLSAYYSVKDMTNVGGETDASAGDNNEFRFEAKYSF